MFDVASLIALAALIVALVVPCTQMACQTPKLSVSFLTRPHDYCLDCIIENAPIKQPVLRFFGLTRNAADIHASFFIEEAGSHKRVCPLMQAMIDPGTGVVAIRARLPAGDLPAIARVVRADANTGQASIVSSKGKTALPHGIYDLTITVAASERSVTEIHRFHVGEAARDLYWDTPPTPV